MDAMTRESGSRTQPPVVGHSTQYDARNFDRGWAVLALFGSGVSLFIAIVSFAMRLGLPNPPLLFPASFVIVTATLCGPLLLPSRGFIAEVRYRTTILPLAGFAIFLSVALALWLGQLGLIFYAALAAFGIRRAIALTLDMRHRMVFAMAALGAAVYLFIVVHNLDYAGILTPEQSILGLLNHDTRFHSAIAFLIQNYGKLSIGLDGVLPLRYHFGSHIWLAGLGLLTGSEPASSYGAAVPIVAAPLLVTCALISGFSIDAGRKQIGHYLLIGLGLIFLADSIDIRSYYISESYTFGLIALSLLLPLLAFLARRDESSMATSIGFAIAILVIPVVFSFKVSVGILWTVSVGWISLRRFGFTTKTFIIAAACLLPFFFSLLQFAPGPNDYRRASSSLIIPFYYLRLDPQLQSVASFLLPLCLVLLRLKGSQSLRTMIASKSDLLIEVTIIVAVVGALPATLGIPQDSSVWYFLNVCQWYAIAVLLATITSDDLASLFQNKGHGRLAMPVIAVMVFVTAAQFVRMVTPTFGTSISAMIYAVDRQSGGNVLKGRPLRRYFIDTLKAERVLYGKDFRAALASSPGSRLIEAVRNAPNSDKSDFAVFIPPSNVAFWQFQSLCRDKHDVQVALSGRPSLLGGPPASYNCPRDAYTTAYGEEFDSVEIVDSKLCSHALTRSVRHVFVLNDIHNNENNRTLDCTKKP